MDWTSKSRLGKAKQKLRQSLNDMATFRRQGFKFYTRRSHHKDWERHKIYIQLFFVRSHRLQKTGLSSGWIFTVYSLRKCSQFFSTTVFLPHTHTTSPCLWCATLSKTFYTELVCSYLSPQVILFYSAFSWHVPPSTWLWFFLNEKKKEKVSISFLSDLSWRALTDECVRPLPLPLYRISPEVGTNYTILSITCPFL